MRNLDRIKHEYWDHDWIWTGFLRRRTELVSRNRRRQMSDQRVVRWLCDFAMLITGYSSFPVRIEG